MFLNVDVFKEVLLLGVSINYAITYSYYIEDDCIIMGKQYRK